MLLSHYKTFAIVFKSPNSKLFGYKNFALAKVLWALPTPTTFKKVDQIFMSEYNVCNNSSIISRPLLNHNLPQLLKILKLMINKKHKKSVSIKLMVLTDLF